MNSRSNKIDEYLKQLYSKKMILSDEIYEELSSYDITAKELLEEEIEQLQSNFKEEKNVHIYNNLFDFFIETDKKNKTNNNIRLYLNVNKKTFVKTLRKIFKFICSNNIKSEVRMAFITRADSVVIKLDNIENCKKIIEYIKSDKKILKSLDMVTPLMFSDNNIGISCDGILDFNLFVSGILNEYFINIEKNNEDISVKSLIDFCTMKYDYIFKNPKGFSILRNNLEYNRMVKYYNEVYDISEDEVLLDIDKLFQTFILEINSSIKQEDIYDKLLEFSNDTYKEQKIQSYKKLKSSKFNKYLVKSLLDEYILYCFDNYELSDIIMNLDKFISSDFPDEKKYLLITKKNNFRKQFIENNMALNINRVVTQDIKTYVEQLLSLRNMLDSYIVLGTLKYGVTGIKVQLSEFINSNSKDKYKYITSFKGLRNEFIKQDMHVNHIRVIKKTTDEYINDLLSIKCLLDDYIIWCINNHGIDYLYNQLNAFLDQNISESDRYKYITSKNNYRDKFIENKLAIRGKRILGNVENYIQIVNQQMNTEKTSEVNEVDYIKLRKILNEYIIYSNEIIGYDSTCLLLDVFKNNKNYGLFKEPFQRKFAKYNMADYIYYLTEGDIYKYVKNLLYKNIDIEEEKLKKV